MKKLAFVLCFIPGVAFAQMPQQASPEVQALYAKLGNEVDNGIKCTSAVIELRQQLAQAQAELAKLKTKPEKKPESKK